MSQDELVAELEELVHPDVETIDVTTLIDRVRKLIRLIKEDPDAANDRTGVKRRSKRH